MAKKKRIKEERHKTADTLDSFLSQKGVLPNLKDFMGQAKQKGDVHCFILISVLIPTWCMTRWWCTGGAAILLIFSRFGSGVEHSKINTALQKPPEIAAKIIKDSKFLEPDHRTHTVCFILALALCSQSDLNRPSLHLIFCCLLSRSAFLQGKEAARNGFKCLTKALHGSPYAKN